MVIGLDEGLLSEVRGIFATPGHAQAQTENLGLILLHQDAEGSPVAPGDTVGSLPVRPTLLPPFT